jgi:hypothetical protein
VVVLAEMTFVVFVGGTAQELLVNSFSLVEGTPNTANLGYRSKHRSLELVEVVAELVGVLDEVGLFRLD